MQANIKIQEITSAGVSEPQTITVVGPTFDRIQKRIREVLQTDDIILLNKDLIDRAYPGTLSTITCKYYRTKAAVIDTDSIVCSNGVVINVKNTPIGTVLEESPLHQELTPEEYDTLIKRLPRVEDEGTMKVAALPLPKADHVVPAASKSNAEQDFSIKAVFNAYDADNHILHIAFGQKTNKAPVEIRSDPALPDGKWEWMDFTTLQHSAKKFPRSTAYTLTVGPPDQKIGEKVKFSTDVVDISSAFVENTSSPILMVIFNQKVKNNVPVHIKDEVLTPYVLKDEIANIFKTKSAVDAYNQAKKDDVSVLFYSMSPVKHHVLEIDVAAGSHSLEGPLKSEMIVHQFNVISPFTIASLSWVSLPPNSPAILQISHPLHPDCLQNLRNYFAANHPITDIFATENRVHVYFEDKEAQIDLNVSKKLANIDGMLLSADYVRTFRRFAPNTTLPLNTSKIINVEKNGPMQFQLLTTKAELRYPVKGHSVANGTKDVKNTDSEWNIVTIDLTQYMATRKFVLITVDGFQYFVQKTNLLIDSFSYEDGIKLAVYNSDLKPLDNATVSYLVHNKLRKARAMLVDSTHVETVKIETEDDWGIFSVKMPLTKRRSQDWFVTTDRGLYQPGELVHVTGFVRKEGGLVKRNITCVVQDARSNHIWKQVIDNSSQSFDFEFELPAQVSTGSASIAFYMKEDIMAHEIKFDVREFRVPDNEILISSLNAPDNNVAIETEIKSFIGDEVAGATTKGNFTVKSAHLTLPQYPGYTFYSSHDTSIFNGPHAECMRPIGASSRVKSTISVYNATSMIAIQYQADSVLRNGERLQSQHVTIFRPKGFAVGLDIHENQLFSSLFPSSFKAMVIDENDNPVNNVPVLFELWTRINQEWKLKEQFTRNVINNEPIPTNLNSGEYILLAYVVDPSGNLSFTRSEIFGISDDTVSRWPISVTVDGRKFTHNETAQIAISALPKAFKNGVCHVHVKGRGDLVTVRKFIQNNEDFTVEIPLNSSLAPKAQIYCSIIGWATTKTGTDVHVALSGSTTINVKSKGIKFLTEMKKSLKPTEETLVTFNFEQPLPEDVKMTVWAVDDAVLKLAQFFLENPLEYFASKKAAYEALTSVQVPFTPPTTDAWTARKFFYVVSLTGKVIPVPLEKHTTLQNLREHIQNVEGIPFDQGRFIYYGKQLDDNTKLLSEFGIQAGAKVFLVLRLRGGDSAGPAPVSDATPITARKIESPLAFFKTFKVAAGSTSAHFNFVAQNALKRFKLFALAIGTTVYGKEESSFIVTKPFSISAVPIKHACISDELVFPVTLFNRSEHEVNFEVATRAKSIEILNGKGFKGTIKANSSTSVDFNLKFVGVQNGTIEVVAQSKHDNEQNTDAIEYPTTIRSLYIRRNIYGRFEGKNDVKSHAIDLGQKYLGNGEATVTISPSILSQGIDALQYIGDYRYMCSEQLSSQMLVLLPYLTLHKFVKAPNSKSPEEIRSFIKNAIKKLESRSLGNGKFSYWDKGDGYATIDVQVAHALTLASQAGFKFEHNIRTGCVTFLHELASKQTGPYAYAAYVLSLMKEAVPKLGTKATGLNLAVLASVPEAKLFDTLMQQFGKDGKSDQGKTDYEVWDSKPKFYALVILAILNNPKKIKEYKDQLHAAMQGLLRVRTNGHWSSTQSNMWALTALAAYYNVHERDDLGKVEGTTVKVWLGTQLVAELTPEKPSMKFKFDAASELQKHPQVTLQTNGAAMWYSMQLKLNSGVAEGSDSDATYTINRRVFGLEHESDVQQEEKNGQRVYRVKQGAYVGVSVQVETYHQRRFLAVQDPTAAGFEPLEIVPDTKRYFSRTKWDHQDVRSDGADSFSDSFYGRKEFTYKVLALRKGRYTMPSCHVEEMYSPDMCYDSDPAIVIIE